MRELAGKGRRKGRKRSAQSGANPSASTLGKNFLTSSIAISILSSETAILSSQKSGSSSPSTIFGSSHSTSGPKRISPSRLSVRWVPSPERELQKGAVSGRQDEEKKKERTHSPPDKDKEDGGRFRHLVLDLWEQKKSVRVRRTG